MPNTQKQIQAHINKISAIIIGFRQININQCDFNITEHQALVTAIDITKHYLNQFNVELVRIMQIDANIKWKFSAIKIRFKQMLHQMLNNQGGFSEYIRSVYNPAGYALALIFQRLHNHTPTYADFRHFYFNNQNIKQLHYDFQREYIVESSEETYPNRPYNFEKEPYIDGHLFRIINLKNANEATPDQLKRDHPEIQRFLEQYKAGFTQPISNTLFKKILMAQTKQIKNVDAFISFFLNHSAKLDKRYFLQLIRYTKENNQAIFNALTLTNLLPVIVQLNLSCRRLNEIKPPERYPELKSPETFIQFLKHVIATTNNNTIIKRRIIDIYFRQIDEKISHINQLNTIVTIFLNSNPDEFINKHPREFRTANSCFKFLDRNTANFHYDAQLTIRESTSYKKFELEYTQRQELAEQTAHSSAMPNEKKIVKPPKRSFTVFQENHKKQSPAKGTKAQKISQHRPRSFSC